VTYLCGALGVAAATVAFSTLGSAYERTNSAHWPSWQVPVCGPVMTPR
jgi:hypothetical protein